MSIVLDCGFGTFLYHRSPSMQCYSALELWTLFQEKCHWIYIAVILLSFLSWKGWNEKEKNKAPISANLGSMINGYEAGDSTKERICMECFVFLYTAIIRILLIDNDACASLERFMMDDVSICLSLFRYIFFFRTSFKVYKLFPKVFLFRKSFHVSFNFSVSLSYINT